jgi:hypothetical protein
MNMVVHVNSPEFRDNPDAVYIGRQMKGRYSRSCWANPYHLNIDGTREEVIAKFEAYARRLLDDPATGPKARERLMALDGKVLGCWCAPKACHGDVLIKLIAELKSEGSP